MWGAREEVESFNVFNLIFIQQNLDIAGLSGGVTR